MVETLVLFHHLIHIPATTLTMYVTKAILFAALFLACVQAQQADQEAKRAAFEGHQPFIKTSGNDNRNQEQKAERKSESTAVPTESQQQQQQAAPQELTPEEMEIAKEGIRQILSQLPFQHAEPLVNSVEGYCSTFEVLCTAACKERMNEEDANTSTTTLGCTNPIALTIGAAEASCKCASFDLTDRVNFAM